jgi:c(7)-type cytochrome triheme protein
MPKQRTSFCLALVAAIVIAGVRADDDVNPEQSGAGDADALSSAEAEAKFLEELHYSHEDFVRIYESLPRDEENKVDWERAVEEGLIAPSASAGDEDVEERIMDFRVVIKFDDMLIKDVVFSHEVHTYWLDCRSCHPKIFVPEVAANRMTMKEIREGKYCGVCHGVVAFPTDVIDAPNFRANCLRCHRERRG